MTLFYNFSSKELNQALITVFLLEKASVSHETMGILLHVLSILIGKFDVT